MLVSIIIATFNAELTIRHAIESVLNQTYQNIELVIVDGASTDRTMEIVKSYSSSKLIVHSETDRGIYDAWNKGVKLSTGDWILFIGADDLLAHPQSIENAIKAIPLDSTNQDNAIYYGRLVVLNHAGEAFDVIGSEWRSPWSFHGKHIWCQFPIPIMAAFYNKSCFKVASFDIGYKIMADIEFVLRVARNRQPIYFGNVEVTKMGFGGISTNPNRSMLLLREAVQIRYKHGLGIINLEFALLATKLLIKYFVSRFFGPRAGIKVVGVMQKIKRARLIKG